MDVLEYVKIKAVPGGALSDCTYVDGVVVRAQKCVFFYVARLFGFFALRRSEPHCRFAFFLSFYLLV